MTIEEEFFKTFGIEKQMAAKVSCTPEYLKCEHCEYYKHIEEYKGRCTKLDYPKITAEKLLEMICLINKNTKNYNKSTYFKQDYKNLKDEILEDTLFCYKTNCLFNKEKQKFKHQISQLFKEEE